MRLHRCKTEFALVLLALVPFLPGIGWGVPYATDPIRTHGCRFRNSTGRTGLVPIPGSPTRLGHLLLTSGMRNPSAQFPFRTGKPVGSLQLMELIVKSLSRRES